MTIAEAAAKYRLPISRLEEAIAAAEIAHYKPARAALLTDADIRVWLEKFRITQEADNGTD